MAVSCSRKRWTSTVSPCRRRVTQCPVPSQDRQFRVRGVPEDAQVTQGQGLQGALTTCALLLTAQGVDAAQGGELPGGGHRQVDEPDPQGEESGLDLRGLDPGGRMDVVEKLSSGGGGQHCPGQERGVCLRSLLAIEQGDHVGGVEDYRAGCQACR